MFAFRSAAVFLLCSATLLAQTATGIITGTIADPVGAVVANAPLTLKNTQTGAIYEASSSGTGNFSFAQLPAATYELTAAVPGFKTFVRANLAVAAAQTIRVDLILEVGTAQESVTV